MKKVLFVLAFGFMISGCCQAVSVPDKKTETLRKIARIEAIVLSITKLDKNSRSLYPQDLMARAVTLLESDEVLILRHLPEHESTHFMKLLLREYALKNRKSKI